MECFLEPESTDHEWEDQRRYQRAHEKSKKVRYAIEECTEYEESETDLSRYSHPHVFTFPVKCWDDMEQCETDAPRQEDEEGRIEEERDDMGEEDDTRSIGAIHKWTLEHFRSTRIESADDQEMEEKKSENGKESETKLFLRTHVDRIRLIGDIENSEKYQISRESPRILDMCDTTIPVRIIEQYDGDGPEDKSCSSDNKVNHRYK